MTKEAPTSPGGAENGRREFTACAFIHREIDGIRQVLIARRADTKTFRPGEFELPGGHVEFGETTKAGLGREIREEFGMEIHVGSVFHDFTYTDPEQRIQTVENIYFATLVDPNQEIRLNLTDHSEYRWISEHDLEEWIRGDEKLQQDNEVQAMHKAFRLLRGEPLNVG